ncbi:MAG: hypothetical protein ABSF98_04410 [Bryobacteraceae bacterium]|jgi:hypothetical protein
MPFDLSAWLDIGTSLAAIQEDHRLRRSGDTANPSFAFHAKRQSIAAHPVACGPRFRALQSAVYGMAGLDGRTLVPVGAILLAVAAAASLIPALGVTRLNPANTLRDE